MLAKCAFNIRHHGLVITASLFRHFVGDNRQDIGDVFTKVTKNNLCINSGLACFGSFLPGGTAIDGIAQAPDKPATCLGVAQSSISIYRGHGPQHVDVLVRRHGGHVYPKLKEEYENV